MPMGGEIRGENLTAQTNGSRTTFTTVNRYALGSLVVSWEGVRLTDEVTEDSGTLTFTLSVTIPSGDRLYVDYYLFHAAYLGSTPIIIDHVIGRLRQDTNNAALRAQVLSWINEGQYEDVQEYADFYFLEASDTITFDGSASYTLSSDFNRMRNPEESVRVSDRVLVPKSLGWLYQRDPDLSDTGDPLYYALEGERTFIPWPVPSSGTCLYDYYKILTEVTDVTASVPEIPLQWRGLLVLSALKQGRKWVESPHISDRIDLQLHELQDRILARNNRAAGFPGTRGRNEALEALFG